MNQVVVDGYPVRSSRDVSYALSALGVPGYFVEYIDDMLDEAARIERGIEARGNSDMRAYEEENESYGVAMDDIKEILETFKGCARLNRDKVLDAFNEIKKLIDNVH
jgi:hypothetical protein